MNLLEEKSDNKKLTRLWSTLILPNDYKLAIINYNTMVANRQIKSINEIVEFIKNQNYYGDVYQLRRQLQIDASKYWINLFFPNDEDVNDKFEDVRNMPYLIIK